MGNTFSRFLRCLMLEYIAFWAIVLSTVVLYELDVLPQGTLVEDVQTSYMMEVCGILLAVTLIPLSLRSFSLSLVRCVKQNVLEKAMVSYRRWSEIRLALLLVPAMVNLAVYYWTLDTTGLLCAAMVMVASLFCVPGMARLKSELNLDGEHGLSQEGVSSK